MSTKKPIRIDGSRWYYSDSIYINVCAEYYELCGPHGYIRSLNDLPTAINGALFQIRLSY